MILRITCDSKITTRRDDLDLGRVIMVKKRFTWAKYISYGSKNLKVLFSMVYKRFFQI